MDAVARKRDRQAFSALFDHFAPRLIAHLMRLGADPATAEELTQEAMTTLWHKASLFDRSKSSVATWLYRVARNRRIDVLRRDRSDCIDINEPMLMPSAEPDMDDAISLAHREETVRAALAHLPEEQLSLVRLAFFEGMSHSEIAGQLHLPLGTVKSRIRLAFTRLRRTLEASGIRQEA
ncbi:sigma-70 family RNA polymerase sigma factor [Phreatobacter stygius]|uniref:sigma-70 family RNA polymerase sigma factor n=1 Tax=Phreatobacter stygius TaxID=1940610 RepID=UPI001FE882FC|nr:sigma-70 family RNA polymerase sigma factor [Phreatobacter stygius]